MSRKTVGCDVILYRCSTMLMLISHERAEATSKKYGSFARSGRCSETLHARVGKVKTPKPGEIPDSEATAFNIQQYPSVPK